MKSRTLRSVATFLAILSVAVTSALAADKKADLPVGSPKINGSSKNALETFGMIKGIQDLAQKHPRRAAFEAAIGEKLKKGELKADHLTVVYEDGTKRVFR